MFYSQDKARGRYAKTYVDFSCGPVCIANALLGTQESTTPNAIIERGVAMHIYPPLAEALRAIRDGKLIGTSPSDLLRLVEHFTQARPVSDVSCISVNPQLMGKRSAEAAQANYDTLVDVSARGLLSIAYVDGATLKHASLAPDAICNANQANSHCVLIIRATVDVIEMINPDSGENGTWERMTLSAKEFMGFWRSVRGNGERTVATAVIGI